MSNSATEPLQEVPTAASPANPWQVYTVTVQRIECSEGSIPVVASSEEEAEAIAMEQVRQWSDSAWDPIKRDTYAVNIELLEDEGHD